MLGSTRSCSRCERYVGVTDSRAASSRCFRPCSARSFRMVLPKRIIGPHNLKNQRMGLFPSQNRVAYPLVRLRELRHLRQAP